MSPLHVFPDPIDEEDTLRTIESYERDYRRFQEQMRRDPTPAIRAAETAAVNPTVPAAAVAYGSQQGLDPDDPTYRQIAQAQADEDVSAWQQLGERLGDSLRWTMAALNSPWDEIQRQYKLAIGAAADLGFEWLTDDMGPWERIHERGMSSLSGGGAGAFENAIDMLVRGVRGLADEYDTPGDVIDAVGAAYTERSRQLPHSPFIEALAGRQDIGDDRFLFLPIPDYSIQEDAGRMYKAWGVTNPTPGRVTATILTGEAMRPDTVPFDWLSGAVDASLLLRADPVNVAGRAAMRARQASRAFAGLAGDGDRIANVLRPRAQTWTASPNGRRAVRVLTDVDSPKEVARITKIDDPATLTRIAATSDPVKMQQELVRAINGRYMTVTPTPETVAGAWTRRGDVVGRGLWVPTPGQLAGASAGFVFGGTDLARYGAAFGAGAVFRRGLSGTRMANAMTELAGHHIELTSMQSLYRGLSKAMDNYRIPAEIQDAYIRRLGNIRPGDGNAVYDLFFGPTGVMRQIRRQLVDAGADPDLARHVTGVWKEAMSGDVKRVFTDATGLHPIRLRGMAAGVTGYTDELVDLATKPILTTEMLNSAIPLPNYRQYRRLMSSTRTLGRLGLAMTLKTTPLTASGLKSLDLLQPGYLTLVMDGLVQTVWKPLVLLRFAWLARVIPEEQARMAAADYSSAFKDPMDWLMWAFHKQRRGGLVGDLDAELVDFRAAMSRHMELSWADSRRTQNVAGQYKTFTQDERYFIEAWTHKMGMFWNDPVARQVVSAGQDDAAEWLARGSGRQFASELGMRRVAADAFDLDEARDYVALVDAYLHRSAGGHVTATVDPITRRKTFHIERPGYDDLRQSVATGKLNGHDTHGLLANSAKRKAIYSEMRNIHKRMQLDATTIDDVMGYTGGMNRHNWTTTGPVKMGIRDSRSVKDIVDFMFRSSMGATTDTLSRAPVFRQAYWQHVEDLASFADTKTLRKIIVRARRAQLPDSTIRRFGRMLDQADDGKAILKGRNAINDLDVAAKAYGVATTRDLLYDLAKRRDITDATRNLLPFAEAWWEILSTWSKLLYRNPSVVYKVQRAGNAMTTGGIIYEDPDTGDDVFTMPLIGSRITESMLYGMPGADTQLGMAGAVRSLTQGKPEGAKTSATAVGRVAGVNLIGSSVLPGLGPVAQWSVSQMMRWLAPGSEWNTIREVLFPYGEPDSGIGGIAQAWLPAWARKLNTAFEEEQGLFAHSFSGAFADTYRALYMSGMYDTTDPVDQQRLEDDARAAAKRLTVFRGVVQFVAPTGPAIRYQVEDKNGMEWFTRILADDYNDIFDSVGRDSLLATETFLARYGIDPVALVTPKTDAEKPDIHTEAGMAWQQDNPDIYERYPFTASFLNPADINDEFEYASYARSIRDNRTHYRTPEQWVAAVQRARINLSYRAIRERLESQAKAQGRDLTDRERVYLQNVRGQLDRLYPRGSALSIDYAERRSIMVDELQRWIADPAVASMPVAQAVDVYLQARQAAGNEYNRRTGRPPAEFYLPSGVQTADRGADLREWLTSIAAQLVAEVPEFQRVWDYVFRTEVDG